MIFTWLNCSIGNIFTKIKVKYLCKRKITNEFLPHLVNKGISISGIMEPKLMIINMAIANMHNLAITSTGLEYAIIVKISGRGEKSINR